MPKEIQTRVDYDMYTRTFGTKTSALWQKRLFVDTRNYISLFQFILLSKTALFEDTGSDKYYYDTITKLWATFTDEQVNNNSTERTILMDTIDCSKDTDTILFAINNTTADGVSLKCEFETSYQQYALPAAIRLGRKGCIDALIEKSHGNALKAGLEAIDSERHASDYAPTVFSATEISYYESLMKAKQNFGRLGLQVMRRYLGKLPEVDTTVVKAASSSSIAPTARVATKQVSLAPTPQPAKPHTVTA